MKSQFKTCLAFCVAVFVLSAPVRAAPVTIALVPVGDPGNLPDTNTGSLHGAVSYSYNIGKYDVTIAQYCAFLNSVAATDTYSLYSPSMATDLNVAGISQSGVSGSYTYSVIGSGQRPITYVTWYDAARFSNWLTNGQGSGGTETGVYNLNGSNPFLSLPADHSSLIGTGTKWFLPTDDEWYKAAYYKGGNTNAYWTYPFKSNTQPTANAAPGGSNSANFLNHGVFAVTQSASFSSSQNYLTDVGAYSSALSPYGAYDMGGDVNQWNETGFVNELSSYRKERGGYWHQGSSELVSTFAADGPPTSNGNYLGFRVAELPEPSTVTLFALGTIGVWFAGRRRRGDSLAKK